VNGSMACPGCADTVQRQGPKDSHAAFIRGLLLGMVAALIGMVLYATFEIMSGIIIGYMSLGVGFLVGKAIMMGSKGVGGRRYQIAAALLTYAAVSLAAIPVLISQIHKEKTEHQQVEMKQQPAPDQQSASQQDQPTAQQPATQAQPPQQAKQEPAKPKMGVGAIIGALLLWGMASPFLELQDLIPGLIGLLILSVGIRIAWKITAGTPVQIDGPYDSPAPAST